MKRKIRIGLDFDGVVAYNPFRIIRKPISVFKREVLGIRRLKFFVPKNFMQKAMWSIMHESSIFPGKGVSLLKEMARDERYEFHLITARFEFLKDNLEKWLDRYDVRQVFTTININEDSEQPHIYKERVVSDLRLDYYVEDNLDIVTYLSGKVRAQVCWIYNVVDKLFYSQPREFPYLGKALEWISQRK